MATITGTSGDDTLYGGTANDLLVGLEGNDYLEGGAGNDTLEGGAGNDVYLVQDIGDVVVEGTAAGNDTVFVDATAFTASAGVPVATYIAPVNVENVVLSQAASSLAFNITGVATTRTIAGNAGANQLVSAAGSATTLVGLGGNDTYVAGSAATVIQEAVGGGTDILFFNGAAGFTSYTLAAGASIETIFLSGNVVSVTGNELAQTINGTGAANTINGGGGADTLLGGAGNDTYLVSGSGIINNVTINDFGGDAADRVIVSMTGVAGAVTAFVLDPTGAGVSTVGVETVALNGITYAAGAANPTAAAELSVNTQVSGTYANGVTGDTRVAIYGDSASQVMIGDNGDNIIVGNIGNTPTATDTLAGLGGSDTYRVFQQGDVVIDGTNAGGYDVIFTDTDYSLLVNDANIAGNAAALAAATGINNIAAVQQIEVLSAADQNATTALTLTGNTYANTLFGNAGANTFNTGGGTAIDRLVGFGGSDTYNVDVVGTYIEEKVGDTGTDVANVSVDGYALTFGAAVEVMNFTAVGAGTMTGNALAQTMVANAAGTTLVGLGGADTFVGGAGNDTFVVGAANAIIDNGAAGGGSDTVIAAFDGTYTLNQLATAANNGSVTTLAMGGFNASATTFAAKSSAATSNGIVGNGNSQTVVGDDGNNAISGATSATQHGGNADILVGLLGNDTYTVYSQSDIVIESSGTGSGVDTINTSVSYSLLTNAANANAALGLGVLGLGGDATGPTTTVGNVEVLQATGTAGITLTGDNGANTLIGNGGANLLNGGVGNDTLNGGAGADTLNGGVGNDSLIGGAGADMFYFGAGGAANADFISDFVSGSDKIGLGTDVGEYFAGNNFATGGAFGTSANFVVGTEANAANSQIIYNSATGQLFYDADGTGAGAAQLFATVTPGTTITASDFVLVTTIPV